MEVCATFADEAYSVAFHPTALLLLVGFADKLRLMTLLMDGVRTYRELAIKQCRECHFSYGGHLFAAVNGNTIGVYNSYTCEVVANLRGHNSKVRALCWAPDDTRLISAGVDGAVYEWRLSDLKRAKENVLKGCVYTSVACTPDCRSLFAAGTDNKLKELEDTAASGTQVVREVDTGVALTQLALPTGGRMLFAATDTGCVRTYRFPLQGEFHEMRMHQQVVTRLRLSFDEALLFSVSEDGSLLVCDVRDKDAKAKGGREQDRVRKYSGWLMLGACNGIGYVLMNPLCLAVRLPVGLWSTVLSAFLWMI